MGAARRQVAIGDPQAPLEAVFAVLDAHGLRDDRGNLADDVHLVSMGDHFDWGRPEDRRRAAESGENLLRWLAAHAPEQVTLILGNHDLCRVGELARFDDASFARAQVEADAGYIVKAREREQEAFRAAYDLPSWESASRDFSTFRVSQRALVATLLRSGRFRAAYAPTAGPLFTHAGVTSDELDQLRVPVAQRTHAPTVAAAINRALDDAVSTWRAGDPLSIPGLHAPGNAAGEGSGMFYHRFAVAARDEPIPRRRYDPSRLPIGLTQAIGHIRHKKCRELLGANPAHAKDGPLRHLRVTGGTPMYTVGLPTTPAPEAATLIFLDGGMNHAPSERYELFDIRACAVFPRI